MFENNIAGVINMKIIWILVLYIVTASVHGNVYAQAFGDIKGQVINARTKEPLIGVNVLLSGTDRGAATDFEGNFAIKNIPVGTYRLRFDYIGFETFMKTDVVVISARHAMVNVELKEDF
jgi:hypothetical protein